MLWVFTLAIMPWGLFHSHAHVHEELAEKNCTHKFHVKNQKENCLICKAHFEKNYTLLKASGDVYLQQTILRQPAFLLSCGYETLISTSLRGPPVFS